MEKNMKKNMCDNWITFLDSKNWRNIANQLYINRINLKTQHRASQVAQW